MFKWNFLFFKFVPIVSCSVTGLYCEKPGSVFFIPSTRHLYILMRTCWAFSSPGWTVLDLSACLGLPAVADPALSRAGSLGHLQNCYHLTALCRICTGTSSSLLYWGCQTWTQHSKCGLTRAELKGRFTFFSLLAMFLHNFCVSSIFHFTWMQFFANLHKN